MYQVSEGVMGAHISSCQKLYAALQASPVWQMIQHDAIVTNFVTNLEVLQKEIDFKTEEVLQKEIDFKTENEA